VTVGQSKEFYLPGFGFIQIVRICQHIIKRRNSQNGIERLRSSRALSRKLFDLKGLPLAISTFKGDSNLPTIVTVSSKGFKIGVK